MIVGVGGISCHLLLNSQTVIGQDHKENGLHCQRQLRLVALLLFLFCINSHFFACFFFSHHARQTKAKKGLVVV